MVYQSDDGLVLVNEQHRISEEHINTCILRVMHAFFKRQEKFKNPPLVNPEQGYQIFANQGLARVLGAAGKAAGAEFCQEKINYGIQLPNSHHSFVHNFSPRSRALDIRLSTCSDHNPPTLPTPGSTVSCFHQAFSH